MREISRIAGNSLADEDNQRFILLVENSFDFIGIASAQDGRVLYVNDAGKRLVGLESSDDIGKTTLFDYILEEDLKEMDERVIPDLLRDGVWKGEYRLRHFKTGSPIPVEVHSFVIKDSNTGQPVTINTIIRDITERKVAEEALKLSETRLKASLGEKDTLLKEIHHRVKNNLQVVSSLLSLQSAHIMDTNVIEAFKESRDRIRSLAMIHEKLYRSKNLAMVNIPEYVKDLVAYLLASYETSENPVTVQFAMKDIFFGIDTAVPCGLVINELVSNALKHAFHRGGKSANVIRIELSRNRGKYKLLVGDNGIGFPRKVNFRKTESLGFQLVIALVRQMRGRISIRSEKGTSVSIIFDGTNPKCPIGEKP